MEQSGFQLQLGSAFSCTHTKKKGGDNYRLVIVWFCVCEAATLGPVSYYYQVFVVKHYNYTQSACRLVLNYQLELAHPTSFYG